MHVGRVGLVYQHKLNGRLNPQEEGEVIRVRESVLSLGHGEQLRDIEKSLARQDSQRQWDVTPCPWRYSKSPWPVFGQCANAILLKQD